MSRDAFQAAAKAIRAFDEGTLFDVDAGKSEVLQGARELRNRLLDLVDSLAELDPAIKRAVFEYRFGCPECGRVVGHLGRDHAEACMYAECQKPHG